MDIKGLISEKIKTVIAAHIEECDMMIEKMFDNFPDSFIDLIFTYTITHENSRYKKNEDECLDECTVNIILPDYISRTVAQAIVTGSNPSDKNVLFDNIISHFVVLGFTYQLKEWLKSGRFDHLLDITRNKIGL